MLHQKKDNVNAMISCWICEYTEGTETV